ncbi:MAG TPA: hypothetical protein VND93_07125 [Myxococcales bacterium]|nr:hypothetical protein [Myxococcales bacterium]
MRARLAIVFCGALLLARCGCTSDPYAVATVAVEPLAVTRCVRVVAWLPDGGRHDSDPLPAAPADPLAVAVFQSDFGPDVSVRAEGYGDPGCAPAMDEASGWQRVRFQAGAPFEFTLTLRPEGSCSDGIDGDGDGLIDCADPACQGAPECGSPPDGGPDGGPPDAGGWPYAPSNFSPSTLPRPGAALVIDCDAGYDTTSTTGWLCGAPVPAALPLSMLGGAPGVLLPFGPLTVTDAGRLTVTGNRPLVLAVRGDARIDGPLLAGADHALPGPGGSRASCPGDGGPGTVGGGGGAGGGGGGYSQGGASGGLAGSGTGTAGGGGAATGNVTLVPLLGGCSGGPGGESTTGCLREGGAGGGGLQLSATGVLRVNSAIAAPGGGGLGGDWNNRCGGGGGGSGGALLLEALRVELGPWARLTANGGAGAEGADNAPSSFQSGENGRIDGPYPARGGTSNNVAAAGGDGGTGSAAPTGGASYTQSTGGGGGGGGGTGRIRLNAVQGCVLSGGPDVLYSPRPTSNLAGDAGCP